MPMSTSVLYEGATTMLRNRISYLVTAALVVASALLGGWKWEHLPH
jgi:hypothetical protein